jgi:hypothetical protein
MMNTYIYDKIESETKQYTSPDFFYQESKNDEIKQALVARDKFISEYSWAIPNQKIIGELKNFIGDTNLVLEVGSGKGLWAYLLKLEGIQIIATDIAPTENSWTNILKYSATEAVNKFYADVLFIVWPPYNSEMASDALNAFAGNFVIYIGEGYYGCTGNNNFHKLLNDKWKLIKKLHNPRWTMCAINDCVFIYKIAALGD